MLARETGLCRNLLQALATRPRKWTPIPALASELGLSRPYAAKLCQRLRGARYLRSRQGVAGGVRITAKGRCATLLDLATGLGDPFVVPHCLLLRETCNPDDPCPMHQAWSALHAEVLAALGRMPAVAGDGAAPSPDPAGHPAAHGAG